MQFAYEVPSDNGNHFMDVYQHEIEHVEGIFEKNSKLRFLEALTFSQKDMKLLGFCSYFIKIDEYEQNQQKREI